MRYKEIENTDALRTILEAGGTLRHYAFQGMDFRPFMDAALKCRYSDCLFLGGFAVEELKPQMDEKCLVYPPFRSLPF
jgi:hypothetical protein